MKALQKQPEVLTKKRRNIGRELIQNRYLYLLMLPSLVFYVIFSYVPMYGLTLAFKQFNASLGIFGSPWEGLDTFKSLFADSYFWYVFFNTLRISLGRIIIVFPFPIMLALLFTEFRANRSKKVLQTIYTFPHFLSWVILSGIIMNFLDWNGPVNIIMEKFGLERQVFMGNKSLFIPILYITDIWKECGWSSIIYMAAIVGIDQSYYEAADLDGATRMQKIWHITLPTIRPTILILLTMTVGAVMNEGFDQILNLSNPVVERTSDIIETYIYRITFKQGTDFSFSTAVGLFKSVINTALLLCVDTISRKVEDVGLFN